MYDDDRDALAAEYVLGTLSADERDQAEALLVIDPGFAEIVRLWERRLGELNVMVEAVEPPPDVWDRIKTEIDGAEQHIAAEIEAARPANEQTAPAIEASLQPTIEEATPQIAPETPAETMPEVASEPTEPTLDFLSAPAEDSAATPPDDPDDSAAVAALASSLLPPDENTEAEKAPSFQPTPAPAGPKIERSAEVVYLAHQARRWRGFTVAMSAIAALLAVYIAVGQFAPGLLPMGRLPQSAATAPPPSSRLVAVLQQEPTAPAFLLTVDPQNRTMTVRRVTGIADQGRSYELWLIPNDDPKPRSLGLVGADEFTTRPLPPDFDVAAVRAASYAVSLEPAGGSPSGAPTGPVLFTGKMVESVPAATLPKT
jgi:anti-sigma-K factor RskA